MKGKYGVYRNFEYRCFNRKFIFNLKNSSIANMKKIIYNEFKKLDLMAKAKNYISNFVITDQEVLESIFNQGILDDNIENVFKLMTYGVDIFNPELEIVRYKLSYGVYVKDEWKANYYIFFDEQGNFIDDFFDM